MPTPQTMTTPPPFRRPRAAGLALLLALASLLPIGIARAGAGKCAGREDDPDCLLYKIARRCLDPGVDGYCEACPSPRTGRCDKTACEETTEVWTGSPRFVAIRDITMCWCPKVLHGLVMPMGAVSGIEDPDRPQAIWKFAWDVAGLNLAPAEALLVVTPLAHRTQNQLHVHLLPADPSKKDALEALPFEAVGDLYQVWAKAEAVAAARGIKEFGVAVHQAEWGAGEGAPSWHVHVGESNLGADYSLISSCPPKPEPKAKRR